MQRRVWKLIRQKPKAGEIAELRNAARLFDVGVRETVARIELGQTVEDLKAIFETVVRDAVQRDPSLGPFDKTFLFPNLGLGDQAALQRGDIVKLDCGVRVNGYWSEGCRHFCIGSPSRDQQLVHNALYAGFCAARALIRPGARMSEVFNAAIEAVRAKGLPNYSRGHVGHSIGLDDQTEEPPFLGPNDTVLVDNMVVCLELPYYPADVRGFNIEDMFFVSPVGCEALTTLPHDLVALPV